MPTARELLEQAEALMRRNRSGRIDTEAAAPGDSDAAVVPQAAAATGADVAAEPLPPPPAAVAVPPEGEGAPTPASLDDIPVLTEIVEEIEAPTILDAVWDGGEASDWGEFDIIEEIEAPSIVDLPEEGGEPSVWGVYDTGEPTLGGAAPHSVMAVPPVTYFRDGDARRGAAFAARARAAAAAEDRSGTTGEGGVFVVDEALIEPRLLATEGAGEPLAAAVASAAAEGARERPPGLRAVDGGAALADDDGIETLYDVVVVREGGSGAAGLREPDAAATAGAGTAAPGSDGIATVALPQGAAVPAIAPTGEPVPVAGEDAAIRAATPDPAQWEALAEEIRMQVLQRIDLFTDSGLQDQLKARLQPIVDRASADLVVAINQHVGQLLRSYVAEAIEREIEKWRGGGH
jgi:hypothetical protein